jgi:hypothetical protein
MATHRIDLTPPPRGHGKTLMTYNGKSIGSSNSPFWQRRAPPSGPSTTPQGRRPNLAASGLPVGAGNGIWPETAPTGL